MGSDMSGNVKETPIAKSMAALDKEVFYFSVHGKIASTPEESRKIKEIAQQVAAFRCNEDELFHAQAHVSAVICMSSQCQRQPRFRMGSLIEQVRQQRSKWLSKLTVGCTLTACSAQRRSQQHSAEA